MRLLFRRIKVFRQEPRPIARFNWRFDIGSSDDANEERIDPEKIENFVDVELLLVILAARCSHRDSHETDETKSDGIVQDEN
jgi:hypothetical protein